MEILVTGVSFTLLGGLLISPIVTIHFLNRANIKYKFIVHLAAGVFLTASITLLFAWWGYASDEMLLAHYGYSYDGWSDKDYYKNVAPENVERVRELVTSTGGIGWPLKATMNYAFYSPFFLILYVATYLINWRRKEEHSNNNV